MRRPEDSRVRSGQGARLPGSCATDAVPPGRRDVRSIPIGARQLRRQLVDRFDQVRRPVGSPPVAEQFGEGILTGGRELRRGLAPPASVRSRSLHARVARRRCSISSKASWITGSGTWPYSARRAGDSDRFGRKARSNRQLDAGSRSAWLLKGSRPAAARIRCARIRTSFGESTGSAARRSARRNDTSSTTASAAVPVSGVDVHPPVLPPSEVTRIRQVATDAIRSVPR